MNSNQPPKSERLDFLKWSMNWVNNNALVEDIVFDIFELGTMLQTLGFRVTEFDRNDELRNENEGNAMGSVKIEISCTKSGLRTVLSKSDSVCKCPHFKEKSEELEYVKTLSKEKINSYLIPNMNHKTTLMVGLFYNIYALIQREVWVNSQMIGDKKPPIPTAKLTTDPDWQVDPRMTPPKGTSSPISNVMKTVDLFGSEHEREIILNDFLQEIKLNLISATKLVNQNNDTVTKPLPGRSMKSKSKHDPFRMTPNTAKNLIKPLTPNIIPRVTKNVKEPQKKLEIPASSGSTFSLSVLEPDSSKQSVQSRYLSTNSELNRAIQPDTNTTITGSRDSDSFFGKDAPLPLVNSNYKDINSNQQTPDIFRGIKKPSAVANLARDFKVNRSKPARIDKGHVIKN